MTKLSVRFYNNHEVRAVWDEKNAKWWFSANDIVIAVNNESDYKKAANYWRWLKKRFETKNIQLVSISHDFKFESPDGKKRAADALDYDAVLTLAKNYPGGRAADFIDWFTYSDNSIDGQSRKKAYALFDSNIIDERDIGKRVFFSTNECQIVSLSKERMELKADIYRNDYLFPSFTGNYEVHYYEEHATLNLVRRAG